MRTRVLVHVDSEVDCTKWENSQASGSISTPEIHAFVVSSFIGAETSDPTRLGGFSTSTYFIIFHIATAELTCHGTALLLAFGAFACCHWSPQRPDPSDPSDPLLGLASDFEFASGVQLCVPWISNGLGLKTGAWWSKLGQCSWRMAKMSRKSRKCMAEVVHHFQDWHAPRGHGDMVLVYRVARHLMLASRSCLKALDWKGSSGSAMMSGRRWHASVVTSERLWTAEHDLSLWFSNVFHSCSFHCRFQVSCEAWAPKLAMATIRDASAGRHPTWTWRLGAARRWMTWHGSWWSRRCGIWLCVAASMERSPKIPWRQGGVSWVLKQKCYFVKLPVVWFVDLLIVDRSFYY